MSRVAGPGYVAGRGDEEAKPAGNKAFGRGDDDGKNEAM